MPKELEEKSSGVIVEIVATDACLELKSLADELQVDPESLVRKFIKVGMLVKHASGTQGYALVRRTEDGLSESDVFALFAEKVNAQTEDSGINYVEDVPYGTETIQIPVTRRAITRLKVTPFLLGEIREFGEQLGTTPEKILRGMLELGNQLVREEIRGTSRVIVKEETGDTRLRILS